MVRRVLLGRRDDVRRRSRWTGSAAVAAGGDRPGPGRRPRWSADDAPAATAAVRPAGRGRRRGGRPRARSSPGSCAPAELASRGGQAGARIAPVRLAPIDVGVASHEHVPQTQPVSQARGRRPPAHVAPGCRRRRLAGGRPFRAALHDLPGWTTGPSRERQGRRARRVVAQLGSSSSSPRACARSRSRASSWREGRYPFGSRLDRRRHAASTGRAAGRISRSSTPTCPQKIEDLGPPRPVALDDQRRSGPAPSWTRAGRHLARGPRHGGSSAPATSTSTPAPTSRTARSGGPMRDLAARPRRSTYQLLGTGHRADAPADGAQHRLRLGRPPRPARPT